MAFFLFWKIGIRIGILFEKTFYLVVKLSENVVPNLFDIFVGIFLYFF